MERYSHGMAAALQPRLLAFCLIFVPEIVSSDRYSLELVLAPLLALPTEANSY